MLFISRYRGYCPQLKYDYGHTYGIATDKLTSVSRYEKNNPQQTRKVYFTRLKFTTLQWNASITKNLAFPFKIHIFFLLSVLTRNATCRAVCLKFPTISTPLKAEVKSKNFCIPSFCKQSLTITPGRLNNAVNISLINGICKHIQEHVWN